MKKIFYKLGCVINLVIAYSLYFLTKLVAKNYFFKSDIYIFGTGNGLYENNIGVFCDYILEKESLDIYYVTHGMDYAPNRDNLKILKRGSIKTYYLSFLADVLIFDTSHSDIAPGANDLVSALKVNVNHGLEGLKKLPTDYYSKVRADINCSVSELERNIKIAKCGAQESSVYITGLPRLDKIKPMSCSNDDVLLFLTWRPWLESNTNEMEKYISTIQKFISEEVSNILGTRTLYLKVHVGMCIDIQSTFSNIVVLSDFSNFTEIVQRCGSLISDYSSVAWDFIYNSRPVLFYCYDYNTYLDRQGLYINYSDTFANNFSTKFFHALEFIKDNKSFSIDSKLFFKYQDQENCNRIFRLIQSKLEGRH